MQSLILFTASQLLLLSIKSILSILPQTFIGRTLASTQAIPSYMAFLAAAKTGAFFILLIFLSVLFLQFLAFFIGIQYYRISIIMIFFSIAICAMPISSFIILLLKEQFIINLDRLFDQGQQYYRLFYFNYFVLDIRLKFFMEPSYQTLFSPVLDLVN